MNSKTTQQNHFEKLLKDEEFSSIPKPGDLIKGKVIGIAKNEIFIDINGVYSGIIRGKEIIDESTENSELKVGDEVETTVLEQENENGMVELSLRFAGHQKAWDNLSDFKKSGDSVDVKIVEANRGGLMIRLGSVFGFLPVSQLLPEHYPRVEGGDKNKILEKLKSFIGQEFCVRIIDADETQNKLIVSEKQAHDQKRAEMLQKYKVGDSVEGKVTAITDFGVFVEFDSNFEGLIHISELSWQRVDNPNNFVKSGDKVKAEIINIEGPKIFLSMKRLTENPWDEVKKKYSINDKISGKVIKINPFGLFVQLDKHIQGLAHVSELGLDESQKIEDLVKLGEEKEFRIISIEPEHHRLGLSLKMKSDTPNESKKTEEIKEITDKKTADEKEQVHTDEKATEPTK
jgi:small subunit ribosomal protein S1